MLLKWGHYGRHFTKIENNISPPLSCSSDPNSHIPTPPWSPKFSEIRPCWSWLFSLPDVFFKNGPSIADLPKFLVSDDHKAPVWLIGGFFQKWYEVDGYTMVLSWLFRFWNGLDGSLKLKWFRKNQNTLVGCIFLKTATKIRKNIYDLSTLWFYIDTDYLNPANKLRKIAKNKPSKA